MKSEFRNWSDLRVTAFSANFSPRASQIFSDFQVRHPEVRFEFLPGAKWLYLLAGEADVALRLTDREPDETLICRHIIVARFSLFSSRTYRDAHGFPASPDDLAGHRFITFRREGVTPRFHDWLMDRVLPEQIVMSCSEAELMGSAIKSGHGPGIVNLKLAEHEPALLQCFEPRYAAIFR